MTDDLVKRLRSVFYADSDLLEEAADRIEELEAEIARLRQLIPRPDQTQDELVWRDHMRGVPLAALAKEFGITKERMRHRLKRIAENRLHLTGDRGASGE
jgi:hypothetical protein